MRIDSRTSDYRHSVTVEKYTSTKDATGAPVLTWVTHCKVMAAIYPGRGKELAQDGKLLSQGMFSIWMRYDSRTADIDHKMRIKYGSRIFEILDINNLEERNVKLEFVCKEEI